MNFSYGIIAIVGVLVAISIGFIAAEPNAVIEPRETPVNSHILPKTAVVGDTLIIEVEFRDNDNQIVDHVNYDITAIQNGNSILSDLDAHRHPGMHPIHETSVLDKSKITIKVTQNGLGHGDDISGSMGNTDIVNLNPEVME